MARAGLLEAWSSERRGSVAWAPVRAARAQEADTQAGAQLPGVLTCPLDPGDSSWGISGPAGLSPPRLLEGARAVCRGEKEGQPQGGRGGGHRAKDDAKVNGAGPRRHHSFPTTAASKPTDRVT